MAAEEVDPFSELCSLPCEESQKRDTCQRCRRPAVVCICSCFPDTPIAVDTRVIILQHPNEEGRRLATVPLLQECVAKDRLHIVRGKRFAVDTHFSKRHYTLQTAAYCILGNRLSLSATAVALQSLPREPIGREKDDHAAVIVLDGTWAQAKGMYVQNHLLHRVRQVQLDSTLCSEYVVRTQPTRDSLSTLESVAHALAWFENRDDIIEVLLCPLRCLCQYQLDCGAVPHHSKDSEYARQKDRDRRQLEPP